MVMTFGLGLLDFLSLRILGLLCLKLPDCWLHILLALGLFGLPDHSLRGLGLLGHGLLDLHVLGFLCLYYVLLGLLYHGFISLLGHGSLGFLARRPPDILGDGLSGLQLFGLTFLHSLGFVVVDLVVLLFC